MPFGAAMWDMGQTIVVTNENVVHMATLRDVFGGIGANLQFHDPDTPAEVIHVASDCHGMMVGPNTPINRDVLNELNLMEVVGRAGIGVDNIDLNAAAANNTVIVHHPSYCIDEVSTHALSLILACHRKLPIFDSEMRKGNWDWQAGGTIPTISALRIGLVGFGKIPRRLVEKLRALTDDIVAFDPFVSADEMRDFDVEKVDFDSILSSSDIVTIHAPLTDDTRHMFDESAFKKMRSGSIVINTSRGELIDEPALVTALSNGDIAFAGLDVFESEPPENSDLFGLENTVLTPHVSWYSEDARRTLTRDVAEDMVRVLNGDEPRQPVTNQD